MFLKIPGKLRDSVARKSALKADDSIEPGEPEENTTGAEDALVDQITDLEEMVNKRTRELEEARQQLNQLASTEGCDKSDEKQVVQPVSTLEVSDKDEPQVEELFSRPNQLADEQPVESVEKEPSGEVKAPEVAVAQAGGEAETKEPSGGGESNAFSDIFGGEEEEENPLMGLIESLPDAGAEELLAEVKEINEMIGQWSHK